jgi:hypothetical protein
MLSRRTTFQLAEIMTDVFSYKYDNSSTNYQRKKNGVIRSNDLYDFLFTHEYAAWFCNTAKLTGELSLLSRPTRELKELILKLHTGETQFSATPNWTWQQRIGLGQKILRNLAEDLLNSWFSVWCHMQGNDTVAKDEDIEKLIRFLELDGYYYQNSKLLSPENDILDLETETRLLKNLFRSLGLGNSKTTFYHLSLSAEHYESGKWEDSISNSRKFLECILQEVALYHSKSTKNAPLPRNKLDSPVQIRDYLQTEKLLESKETQALAKFYSLLSHTGSHPYMAEKDQARLLRHLALTFSQFIMLRLQGFIEATA